MDSDSLLLCQNWQHIVEKRYLRSLRAEGDVVFEIMDLAGKGTIFQYKSKESDFIDDFCRQNSIENGDEAEIYNQVCTMIVKGGVTGCGVTLCRQTLSESSTSIELMDDDGIVWKMVMARIADGLNSVLPPLLAICYEASKRDSELWKMLADRDSELAEHRTQHGALKYWAKRPCQPFQNENVTSQRAFSLVEAARVTLGDISKSRDAIKAISGGSVATPNEQQLMKTSTTKASPPAIRKPASTPTKTVATTQQPVQDSPSGGKKPRKKKAL